MQIINLKTNSSLYTVHYLQHLQPILYNELLSDIIQKF